MTLKGKMEQPTELVIRKQIKKPRRDAPAHPAAGLFQ